MHAIRLLKRQMVYLVPAIMLFAAMWLRVENPPILQVFQLKLFDLYNQIHPREYKPVPVAILDLDDETLKRSGLQWPWPRSKLADMLVRLFEAGAKVVAFDVVFAEPDRTSPKQALSVWLNQRTLDLEKLSPPPAPFPNQYLSPSQTMTKPSPTSSDRSVMRQKITVSLQVLC
jgi:adenylate cyclase